MRVGLPAEAVRLRLWCLAIFIVLVVAALSLSGCATSAVEEKIVEVKVPVAVQPIKPEQVPVIPTPLPARPLSLSAAADVLMAKWCEAVIYIIKADPLLRVSSGQVPGQAPLFPECEGDGR